MLPPGGGTNYVDPRYLSLFVTFNIMFPAQEVVEKIYSEILKAHSNHIYYNLLSILLFVLFFFALIKTRSFQFH